jgi:predicted CXXCH cytochrome family protein
MDVDIKKLIRWVICAFILAILTSSTLGCSKHSRHRVLTFFFTGVPPLEEEVRAEEKKTVENQKTVDAEIPLEKKEIDQKPKIFSHTPYASKSCESCHAVSGFFRSTKINTATIVGRNAGAPGLLIVPVKELCIKCHKHFSPSKIYGEGLRLHAPAAQGQCTSCHNSHQSENKYLLITKREKICIRCHSAGFMLNSADHKKSTDCLGCHNSHLGKGKDMLQKNYKEVIKRPDGPLPSLPGPQASPGAPKIEGRATNTVSEPPNSRSQAEPAPPVERSRTVPSFSEVENTQRGLAEGVSDEGEGGGNEDEAEPAPPVERSRTVPSFSEVKNTQRGAAEGVSDEGEGVSNEGEAESAPPVERSRTVQSFSEVKNTQRGVAEGVSDEG